MEPDIHIVSEEELPATKGSGQSAPKAARIVRLKQFIRTHHTRLLIALGVLVIIPGAAWAYFEFTKPNEVISSEVTVTKKEPPKPTTKPSPLTGVELAPEIADKPVVASIVENHPDARPQSGLSEAGVVYEALAEGGITRFMALWLETKPKEIGPVRSLRPYFASWSLEFNTPIAHVGGNANAIDMIQTDGVKSLNQFYNGGYFYRTADRRAPHNAYITGEKLEALAAKNGYAIPANFTPSPRKKDEPAEIASNSLITINYSYAQYQVEYRYDKPCNCYNRFLAGAAHIDRNNNQQIQPKNVVVQYMPTSYGKSRAGEQMTIMGTPGSGKALVFRDGGVIEGTWSKPSHKERTKLLDATGKDIPLNAGNTWYSIVPTDKLVGY